MGRRGYSAEFRRKVLDLLEQGRIVASVAHDLDLPDQTIYNWRRQDRIDRGLQAGLNTAEKAELAPANKRIAELETEFENSNKSEVATRVRDRATSPTASQRATRASSMPPSTTSST